MSNYKHQCVRRANTKVNELNTDNEETYDWNELNSNSPSMKCNESDSLKTNNITSFKNQYLDKRRQIETEMLQSSQRSLAILQTSEEIAISTSTELSSQREQLERSNTNLQTINSLLKGTGKSISSIKSPFGSLKNFVISKGEEFMRSWNKKNKDHQREGLDCENNDMGTQKGIGSNSRPGFGTKNIDENVDKQCEFEKQLNVKLECISESVSRLKQLALDMEGEVALQNKLIDNVTVKTENAVETLTTQNKDIKKLIN